MRTTLLLCVVVMLIGCDAVQRVQGIVYDKQTGKPIDSVAIGKTEKEDLSNPFYRKHYSGSDGRFDFNQGGGTSSVELYFTKKGYKTIKQYYPGLTDSTKVYLERSN